MVDKFHVIRDQSITGSRFLANVYRN